jgi:hypothetical protein
MECSGTRLLRTHVFHRVSLTDAFTFSHYQPSEGRTNLTKEVAVGLEKLAEFAAQGREMSMSADKSGGISDFQDVVIETPPEVETNTKWMIRLGKSNYRRLCLKEWYSPLILDTSRGQKSRMAILWMCLC